MRKLLSVVKGLVQANAKAVVPVVVLGVLTVLGTVGVTGEMSVKEAVTLGVTAVLVWFTRNK